MCRRSVPPATSRQSGGRVARTLQVARVDGVQGFVGQGLGQTRGLLPAALVQRDVGVALDARGHVPVGLAMADGQHAGDGVRTLGFGVRHGA